MKRQSGLRTAFFNSVHYWSLLSGFPECRRPDHASEECSKQATKESSGRGCIEGQIEPLSVPDGYEDAHDQPNS